VALAPFFLCKKKPTRKKNPLSQSESSV